MMKRLSNFVPVMIIYLKLDNFYRVSFLKMQYQNHPVQLWVI